MQSKETLDIKDKEILQLRHCIKEFKKYDAERKQYLRKIQDELELYSNKYLTLKKALKPEERTAIEKLEEKIGRQKDVIKGLNKKLKAVHIMESLNYDKEQLKYIDDILHSCTKAQIIAENQDLKARLDNLHKTNSELVYKLVSLQNKLKQYENQSISKE